MPDRIAVLVMAYGGPQELGDVEPYLLDVRGHRETPEHVVEEVRERYKRIGGRSPILEQTQAQAEALQNELRGRDGEFETFVGMRHWHPFIGETVETIAEHGFERIAGLVMAPHYSRMSVEVYYDRLQQAIDDLGAQIQVAGIRSWKDDPGYLKTLEDHIREGLSRFSPEARAEVQLVYTAHSLPEKILDWNDPYPDELKTTFDALRARFPEHGNHFAYQSAAMTPDPWLGPDAGDLMVELIEKGQGENFLVVPMGFVCEHVEVLYDIDIEFKEMVEAAGGRLERIEMPNDDARMMKSLADRVVETAAEVGWA